MKKLLFFIFNMFLFAHSINITLMDFNLSNKIFHLRFISVNVERLDAGRVNLDVISKLLQDQEVYLEVVVGEGLYSETVWGCDLTKGYIEENAFYTT